MRWRRLPLHVARQGGGRIAMSGSNKRTLSSNATASAVHRDWQAHHHKMCTSPLLSSNATAAAVHRDRQAHHHKMCTHHHKMCKQALVEPYTWLVSLNTHLMPVQTICAKHPVLTRTYAHIQETDVHTCCWGVEVLRTGSGSCREHGVRSDCFGC
eukprot:1150960-Pelagomonas_calceolata.AAC.4